jgi:hypothetical protein
MSARVPAGVARAAHRQARLSKALRANLAKRKDQARARAEGENPPGESTANPPPSAAQSPGKPPRSA